VDGDDELGRRARLDPLVGALDGDRQISRVRWRRSDRLAVRDGSRAGPLIAGVGPEAAVDRVVAVLAVDRVVPVVAQQAVVPDGAGDRVVPGVPGDAVVAAAGEDVVVAAAGADAVGATAAPDRVAATLGDDDVGAPGAADRVGTSRPDDGGLLAEAARRSSGGRLCEWCREQAAAARAMKTPNKRRRGAMTATSDM
jgi:hypothetical protein